jgi:competence protein ComEA
MGRRRALRRGVGRAPFARVLRGGALFATLLLLIGAGSVLAAGSLTGVVNVNTASAEELQLLPGVGEARARAIVDARRKRGGFRRVEELVEVKGIGDALLERLRPFLAVSGETTAQLK